MIRKIQMLNLKMKMNLWAKQRCQQIQRTIVTLRPLQKLTTTMHVVLEPRVPPALKLTIVTGTTIPINP
eukprot:UN23661